MRETDPVSNQESEPAAEQLDDELAKKYDPERLLKLVSRRAGRGDPLDPTVRAKYEKRFGVDLGHVRLITGEFAEEFNRKREAYAVTIGGTGMILMGNSPDKSMATGAGQGLLAHELTHVAQAHRGLHRSGVFDDAMEFTSEHEEEAHDVEHEVQHEASGRRHSGPSRAEAEQQMNERVDKIKERVLELAGEATRNQQIRNGASRRP